MRSWLRISGTSGSPAASSTLSSSRNSSATRVVAETKETELSDLEDAMAAAARIVNDDIEGAEARLRSRMDTSSFHQLGLGIAVFVRSILGFEKDIMAEASSRLAECESRAWSDMKKAQKLAEGGSGGSSHGGSASGRGKRHVTGQGCEIYPPGTEFQLLNAEAQLMGAMISVMHESLTEGIKGFYKLRKAFIALDAIIKAEAKVLGECPSTDTGAAIRRTALDKDSAVEHEGSDSDSDLDYVDACEDTESQEAPAESGDLITVDGNPASTSVLEQPARDVSVESATASSAPLARQDTAGSQRGPKSPKRSLPLQNLLAGGGPDSIHFTNPVDAFVHSGANMCFGILLLMISMVPPAFSRLLYIIGFKGDRDRGVQMLWQSTKFNNVNGGVAGLMLLAYYNGLLAFSDILPSEDDAIGLATQDEIVGYPKERCIALLKQMRDQYPDSRLWIVEEARVLANDRRLSEAVAMLQANGDSKMRQVTALNSFELSVNALFLMDWQASREGFLRCVELNDWSHSLYYFIVGAAELEMYRDSLLRLQDAETDEKKKGMLTADAKRHKKAAEEFFRKVPAVAGRKKFLARQMPFEVFALRKVAKWEARAKKWGVDLANAVGVSPGQEMVYLWTGSRRMTTELAKKAIGYLRWERCTAGAANVENVKCTPDEMAIKAVAEAALLGQLGQYQQARKQIRHIVEMDKSLFKGYSRDEWTLPCAHYEMGVLAWRECCDADCWPDADGVMTVEAYRQAKVKECEEYLEHVKTWESFVLDARLGMKVKTGMDSISWLKAKKGWA